MSVEEIVAAITAIYTTHNPLKLDEIPKLLVKYQTREVELLQKIRKKYDIPTPVPTPVTTQPILGVLPAPDSSPRAANTRSGSVFDTGFGSGGGKTLGTGGGGLFGTPGSTGKSLFVLLSC
jgi:hypothetical protein